jgi:hypothetical protein
MQAEYWSKLHDLVDFIEVSRQDMENTAEAWGILGPHMRSILDDFYSNRIMSEERWKLKGIDIGQLKEKQLSYWGKLFSGVVDDVYRTQVRSIAVQHHRHGVTMTDYIASYGWFLNAFEKVLRVEVACDTRRADLMASLRRLVMLDMTIAASSYYIVYVD